MFDKTLPQKDQTWTTVQYVTIHCHADKCCHNKERKCIDPSMVILDYDTTCMGYEEED